MTPVAPKTHWPAGLAVVAAAVIASAAPARAGIINPGTEQAHLDFALHPMFQSVGALRGLDSTGAGFLAGSGVLIHPEWILTAAHCLDNGWTSVQFILDANARDPNRTLHAAEAWYLYPGFVSDGGGGTTNDIALVHLTEPITSVAPAEVYWGDVTPGTHLNWAGYGTLAYLFQGEVDNGGTKRGGENVIDTIGDPVLPFVGHQYFLADFGFQLSMNPLPLEMGATNGDSGSGWFAEVDGATQLVGIACFQQGGFLNTGVIRPAVYQDWIQEVTGIPEPSSALLMLSMIPAFLARNRLQRKTS